MRLLTNDEMLAVSGGHINGQDDPTSLNGNPGRSRGNRGGQSRQSGIQQTAQNCQDGSWTYEAPRVSGNVKEGEITIQGAKASCDRGNSNDNGGKSGGGNDSGNDSGNDDD